MTLHYQSVTVLRDLDYRLFIFNKGRKHWAYFLIFYGSNMSAINDVVQWICK